MRERVQKEQLDCFNNKPFPVLLNGRNDVLGGPKITETGLQSEQLPLATAHSRPSELFGSNQEHL